MAIPTKSKTATILPFGRGPDLEGEEETQVGLPPALPPTEPSDRRAPGVDLSGKPKVLFAIGPGRCGKTMVLSWMTEMTANAGVQAVYAQLDPQTDR